VAEDGGLEGCAIAPGINLSMEALHAAAAQLPRVAIRRPARVVGQDTVEAMQAGIYWGYISLIEGLVDRIKEEVGQPMTVIGTGGVASLFHGATDAIDIFDPDVTIRGLLEIFRRSTQTPAGA
jgi:type III pantothenate kinase